MKRSIWGLFAVLLLVGLSSSAFATSTDSIKITYGTSVATIADNGSCVNVTGTLCSGFGGDGAPASGVDVVSGSVGNWTVVVNTGVTNSPSLAPTALDLGIVATCSAAGCAALDVQFSDINFAPAVPSFSETLSNSDTGGASLTQSAYYSNTNALFAETTKIGSTLTGSGTTGGGAGSVAPFSLTLDQTISATGAATFSTDGNITSVPEPASLTLLGTGLLGLAGFARRKYGKKS